jgi:hypothetical protein
MFDPFGYTIVPCSWWETVRDEYGNPVGDGEITVQVTSATVRLRDIPDADVQLTSRREREPLPQITDGTDGSGRRRKRNGIQARAAARWEWRMMRSASV